MIRKLNFFILFALFAVSAFAQKGITFPGSTSVYASAADASDLNVAAGQSLTVTTWIKTTSGNVQLLISKRAGINDAGPGYELYVYGTLQANFNQVGGAQTKLQGTTTINDGKWHHVALVIDNANGYFIYVDGKQEKSATATNTSGFTNTVPFCMGIRNPLTFAFSGSMDEVHVYNKALSATDMATDMATTAASKPSGMVAGWDFNDFTSGNTTTADVVGSHTATVAGSPTTIATPVAQTITMSSPINVGLTQADFSPATSTSPMPIQYKTSNAAIASVVNGKIHVVAKGTCTIKAYQNAYNVYSAADTVTQTLTVANPPVSINLPYTNNAVIQRDNPIVVTGKSEVNDSITITLDGVINKVKADASGNWTTTFPAKSARSTAFTLSAVGLTSSITTLTNLLCGDVWLATGQSNMAFPIASCPSYVEFADYLSDYSTQLTNANNYPNIRFIQPLDMSQQASTPQTTARNLNGGWTVSSSTTATWYSAAATFFARNIQTDQNIPIGIVEAAVGGTVIEAWTPLAALQNNSVYASAYNTATTGTLPATPGNSRENFPTGNFNGMIAPYTHNPIKGIIVYQGEANLLADAKPNTTYGDKIKATINGWRNAWGISNLPVIYTQICNFPYSGGSADARVNLPLFTEQQEKAMQLSNVWGITTTDIGNYGNIHPGNKLDVGNRLANIALKFVYGKSGIQPLAARKDTIIRVGSTLKVVFKNNTGFHMNSGTNYTGFEIAGIDRTFLKAHATLSGSDVILSDSTGTITNPMYVRFGWDENSNTNLFNDSNTPTARFRDSTTTNLSANMKLLANSIGNASTLKNNMTSGTNPGNYLPATVNAFTQCIATASAVFNDINSTDAAVKTAADSLTAQTIRYKPMTVNYMASTANTIYWYSFSTPYRNTNGNNVLSYQGDNISLKGEAYVSNTPKLMWKLTKNNDGTYNIINKVSGAYLDKNSAANTALKAQAASGTPTSGGWTITPIYIGSCFIVTSGGVQLNQTNSGLNYAIYNWGSGTTTNDAGCQYAMKLELTENVNTAVQATNVSATKVWVANRMLQSNVLLRDIQVYTTTGKRLDATKQLPCGIVIVKIADQQFKVEVK